MIKFLAERKYNYIDTTTIAMTTGLLTAQQYILSGVVLVVGFVLSIFLEEKLKND